MALVEAALRSLVGLDEPALITAAPLLGGRAVNGVRPVAVAEWTAEGPAVMARITLGPFDQPVSFDAVRLYHAGETLVDLPRQSVLNLDPGEIFQESVIVEGTVA